MPSRLRPHWVIFLRGPSVRYRSASVVYPSAHHSFYYPELQPGRNIFGRWVEYNEEAATDASRRMREFLKRHLN
jgi:dienelactone hydrolase